MASLAGMSAFFTKPLVGMTTFSDADLGNVPSGFNSVVLDFGFLTGLSFSGGSVNDGLLPGESASFTVSGGAFAGFTEEELGNSIFLMFHNVPQFVSDVGTLAASQVPEPATLTLLGLGLLGLGFARRRKK